MLNVSEDEWNAYHFYTDTYEQSNNERSIEVREKYESLEEKLNKANSYGSQYTMNINIFYED